MNPQLVFAIPAILLPVVLLAGALYFRARIRRNRDLTWDDLVARLIPLNRGAISRIAEAQNDEPANLFNDIASGQLRQTNPDPGELWELIGGLEGIEALEANCDTLIALACHVQETYPEAVVVAEQLRLQSREIKWHLERLRGAAALGHLRSAFPDYAPRAIATYFTMTQHLLALCEAAGLEGPALRAAL